MTDKLFEVVDPDCEAAIAKTKEYDREDGEAGCGQTMHQDGLPCGEFCLMEPERLALARKSYLRAQEGRDGTTTK